MKRLKTRTGKIEVNQHAKPRLHSSATQPGLPAKNRPNLKIQLDWHDQLCRLEQEMTALRVSREQLRSEVADLELSRNYLSNLFDSSPVGYVILDIHGRIKRCNQEFAAILDLDPNHPHAEPFLTFLTRES